ncbi:hypothetical protein L1049_004355 [Liquidambar formosana]|uniref:Gnk2-homologous domain-containing protein n=1 Tax=Liquidambar formosana TaxID=63359 RepID=A0AAP0X0R0_LIQFO
MGFVQKLAVIIIGLLGLCATMRSDPNTTVLQILCNGGEYSSGDPFGTSLAYVVAELEAVTPTRKDYDYYNISPYPNAFAYGHATCTKNLTSPDCTTCLAAADTTMFGACEKRIGARSVLHDCTIRYEQYPFSE